jgi:hypothetical protein
VLVRRRTVVMASGCLDDYPRRSQLVFIINSRYPTDTAYIFKAGALRFLQEEGTSGENRPKCDVAVSDTVINVPEISSRPA